MLSIENLEKRRLTFPNKNCSDDFPSFSPDGQTLAFTRWSSTGSDIYCMPASGGEPRRLTFTEKGFKSAWTADSREILFGSLDEDVFRVWRIPVSGGELESLNIVNVGTGWFSLSVSRQGNRLVYAEEICNTDIWRIELPASQDSRVAQTQLISSSQNENTPHISPDGKKTAFTSNRSGKNEIWVCDSDGRNAFQLTFSPEGVGSGTPRALTENGIYFIPRNETRRPLLKFFSFATSRIIPIVRLERDAINGPYSGLAVSPDGRWLLCSLTEQEGSDIMLVENFR